ncbi:MAG: hypothetical protein KBF45_03300 [Cyclobacteriaceae bacterium]|jgi:predicted RNase H-like HicB family nuclease/uncharacterized membrane protein YsdA (DUF1294 family)|nr:hypothetical protein [Cyclobacteriaceae bacterium]
MIHTDELEKLESLLQGKAFEELTAEEKSWVGQWIESEVEYNNLRKSEGAIRKRLADVGPITPNPKLLSRLKAQLSAQQANLKIHWWQVRSPGWSTLLIAIIFGMTGWWIGSSPAKLKVEQAYLPTVVYDTVYLASKPDTVFVNHVVYRERPILTKTTYQPMPNNVEVSAKGINMKEKEELENLLVSGSL